MIMYITAGTFNIMLKQADSLGISESDTLHALQLDTSIFNNPTNRIDSEIVVRFIEILIKQKSNDRIGLEMGFRFPSSILGTIINVYQNCRTLKEVFEKSPLYAPAVNTLCQFSNYSDTDYFYHIMKVPMEFSDKYPLVSRQIYESQYGIILQLIYTLTGKSITPVSIYTPYEKEGSKDLLEERIKSTVHFGKPFMMVFDKELLTMRVINANHEILSIAERLIDELLKAERKESISSIIRQHILQTIPNLDLSLKEVARYLNMSDRTLQRKLFIENNSYQNILCNVRKDLALKYLAENISFVEIAFLLGFESQSAFNKFFKKNFEKQPSVFKKNK